MGKKEYANFYTDRKFKNINHKLVEIKDENNYLFASGKYKTKILEEELPEYFVKLYLSIKYEYVSVKNIKDIKYKPNYVTNHLYKDDLLYISYDKPITKNENDNFYSNYEVILYGSAIVNFINAVKNNGDFDIKNIESELQRKKEWFNNRECSLYIQAPEKNSANKH